jgi:hypothetical protein
VAAGEDVTDGERKRDHVAVIHPSYDGPFYRARAQRYEQAAELEPDALISSMLKEVAAACRDKAARCDTADPQHESGSSHDRSRHITSP